jgi:DcrB
VLPVRWFVLFALILVGGRLHASDKPGERRSDRSKAFDYILPEGWKATTPERSKHDLILLPKGDGFNRNIVINDQPGKSSLEVLKRKYERDLARVLKDFQLVSSELVELEGHGQAVRITHTNSMPGVPVRQVTYIIEIAGQRYFICCTVPKDDGEKHDKTFEAFVISMKQPKG